MSLADGISFQAASAGAGTFVFGSARASFLTLAQGVSTGELTDGQTVSYLAQDSLSSPIQREWGHGTFSAGGNSIARTTVLVTVNGNTPATGSALNFATAPYVSLTVLAEDISSNSGARTQRSITTSGELPIVSSDSILNINAVSDLSPVVPLASGRAGAPLTFKNLPTSTSQTLTRTSPNTFDGATALSLVAGAAVTFVPYNDGVNSGYGIQ